MSNELNDALKKWLDSTTAPVSEQRENTPAYDRGATRTTLSRGMTPVYDRGADVSRPDKGARNTLIDQQRQEEKRRREAEQKEREQLAAYNWIMNKPPEIHRNEATISKDMEEVDRQIEERKKAEKAAADAAIPLEEKLPGYVTGNYANGGNTLAYAPGIQAKEQPQGSTGKTVSPEMAQLQQKRQWLEAELYQSKSHYYDSFTEASDFAEKSVYVPTERDADTDSGWEDPLYEYINGNQEAGKYLQRQDEIPGAYNQDGQRLFEIVTGTTTKGNEESQFMSQQEISTYNYLFHTQGKQAAGDYYDFILSDLYRRQKETVAELWTATADNYPITASIFRTMTLPGKSLSYIGQVKDYLDDGKIDQNAPYNGFVNVDNAIRTQVAEKVEKNWGKIGSFGYNTAISMLDFLYTSALTGNNQALTLGIMGSGAAADTVIEAKDRGLSDDQAFALDTITGITEAVVESWNMDTVFDMDFLKGSTLKYMLKNGMAEGKEEVVTEAINLMSDIIISKDKSHWQMSIDYYKDQGYSQSEAVAKAVGDQALNMALSYGGGFLSGNLISGATARIAKGQYAAEQKGAGNTNPFTPMAKGDATDANSLAPTAKENAPQRTDSDPEAAPEADPAADFYRVAAEVAPREQAVQKPKEYSDDVIRAALDETVGAQASTPINNLHAENLVQPEKTFNERIQEVVSEMFPSDLDKAVNEYRSGKAVSDSVAESILGKTGFVQKLQQEVGLNLDGTKAEQVQAVKNAIARYADKQTLTAMAEKSAQYGPDDKTGDHRSVGAAGRDFSGLAAYYNLLSDDNIQAARKDDVRFVEVPKKDAQGRNVSEFAGNAVGSSSIAESFIPTIERLIASGQLSHDTRHTAEGLAKASARILDRGIDETFTKLSVEAAKGVTSADLEDEAFLLVNFFQEMPGENAQKKAAEAFVLLENFAHNSGGALVEIRNLFRRLDARTQLEAWKKEAAKLADAAKLKPEDVTISDKSQQEFLDVANAEETAVTDAAKTLNRSSKQDTEAAAEKATKKVLDRADMTPQQIGNLAGERTAKSATTTSRQTPTADDLYDALMTFIRSKKNPMTPKRRRSNALAALQRYYQDKDSFEAAWQQARRRVEMELGNDERGYQILQQFLDTGGMAQDIMDAYDRRSVSRRAMKEAATATSTNFNQLIASSIQDKQAALAKIQTYISENYGVSGKQAAEMANQIQESFFQELSERQSRRLRSLFAERGQTAVADDNGILPAKFRQLYNLGAFDGDGFISRAALKRLFGADGLVLSREVLNEYGTTSELRKTAVEQKIVQEIADQLPTTLWDALNQWRYFAMLANPSTHGKNMIGTFGMTLIQHGLRDNLAAAMEIGTYYVSGKRTARTKSFLNPLSKKDWQLAASAWNDNQNDVVSRAIKNGGRYGNAKSRVEDAKRAWKFNSHKDNKLISAINSVLGVAESATNLNSKLMDAEDAIFGRTSYSLALAGYLKANRLDHITPEARDYAIKQAQTATFHDDSFLYQKVKGISNSKAVSMSAPFLKTPVNTTARVAEYSPGSLFAACYDFVRAAKHDGKTSADVINDLSTSIVGTALWGFGYWLAKEGLLRIGGSGSEEERKYEERMGFEPWTALIDGEYVDIRALSPVCVPIATGAAIYEAIQNFDDGITFQEAMEALYYIADPILSSSPASNLDGFMYAIRGMDTMTTGELAGTIAAELVESYAGQFIPTFLRRVVNAQDNTQRKSVFTGDPLRDSTQYIRSGLPGERENMYTEYDPWGRPLMQDTAADGLDDWAGTVARALNVFPKSDAHTTDIDDEIKRLLRNGYAAYPTEARKYITIPGIDAEGNSQSEKVQLTTEQWDTYNKTRGEMSYQLAKQIMASPVYAAMGDEEKAALLQAAYNYADELGKQAAIPERYTANIGEHLAGLEGVQDITAALVSHEATDNIADAIDGLAALWSAGRDTSGAVAALEEAEIVFDALDKDVRNTLTESSTGRLKAFLKAKEAGISAEKFSQAFTKYYELGKQYEDESEAATHWESSLKDMVNNRVITYAQSNVLKEGLRYWRQISADSLGKHTEYLAAGFSTDDALELTYAIDALAAETGYADVRPIQRIETIANADYLTESQRIKAMQMYMEDGQIQKMNSIMDELNLTAAEYAEIYRAHLPQDKKDEEIAAYRALGYSQAEAERIYRIYNPTKKK